MRRVLVAVGSAATLCAFTAVEAPRVQGPLEIATWLLAAGWLMLAFGLGVAFQRQRSQSEWLGSVSRRVRVLEERVSPDVTRLTERVEAMRMDFGEVKAAVAEMRATILERARLAGGER